MNVAEIMEQRNAFSFEVFPPKTDVGMEKLCGEGGVLEKLYTLNPDYISCTYGAGGTNVGKNLEVLKKIKADGKCTPVTHFTCVANTKEGIKDQLQTYLDNGIDHMLALRGDIPFGWTGTNGDLHYATELVKFVRKEFGDKFTIAVAGSPEGHIACRSLEADISFLKQKQDEGADYIMTQLCWDMDQFRYWMDAIRAAGIWLPVDVGIMPVLDAAATINMALSRNGCVMSRDLCEIISKNWIFPNPFAPNESEESIAAKKASFKEAGIEYTIKLIDEYRVCGINGIHLYALNKYDDVARIPLSIPNHRARPLTSCRHHSMVYHLGLSPILHANSKVSPIPGLSRHTEPVPTRPNEPHPNPTKARHRIPIVQEKQPPVSDRPSASSPVCRKQSARKSGVASH